jgi:hypothetical protein
VYVVSPRLARAVADAALRTAGYVALGADLSAAAGRARWSAALPDVRLRAGRAIDETARVDYSGAVVGDTRLTGRADVRLEAALTWRLSELVFSGREPALARLQLTFLKQREEVVRSALTHLFRWQKAQNAVSHPDALPEERAQAMLLAVESEVHLAVLTGGWFSAERVSGAPWMVARSLAAPGPTRVAGSRGGGRKRPIEQQKGRSVHESAAFHARPAPPRAPIAPGEPSPVGVNEPRNALRDAKQVDWPQEAR